MVKLNDKVLSFISALPTSRALGWNDMSILPHAWLESGGFEHVIGNYNVWGIKVPRRLPWQGPIVYVQTTEFSRAEGDETPEQALPRLISMWGRPDIKILAGVKGMWKLGLQQGFIDFETQSEAISWYCDFIKRLYPISFNARNEPIKYFYGLIGNVPLETIIDGNPIERMVYQPGRLQYATDPNYVQELIFCRNALQADENLKKTLAAII